MLADPTGSSLLRKVTHGVCYTPQQSERTVRKHRYDSVVEGVGLDRVTRNFQQGLGAVDGGFLVPDQEVVDTAHWLLRNEGLFVGSSSALNVAAAVRTAHALKSQRPAGDATPVRVVTVICDSGSRHMSRLWNPEYLRANYQISWPAADCVPACLQLFKSGGAEV
jgi:cysteine synthase A